MGSGGGGGGGDERTAAIVVVFVVVDVDVKVVVVCFGGDGRSRVSIVVDSDRSDILSLDMVLDCCWVFENVCALVNLNVFGSKR